MGKKIAYIGRQCILWIIALQVLNLSVGSAFSSDNAYDYAYTYNKNYDPTETAVEWIVELGWGQQPAFSYDQHQDGCKCLMKTFHWKTDLQQTRVEPAIVTPAPSCWNELAVHPLASHEMEMAAPPPECPAA